ncbi:MAG: hypothetical protein Q4C66_00960 [Lachnospiraceae bacterium]|nr:hypothetical protein [Lachnospiraceae bacterium]
MIRKKWKNWKIWNLGQNGYTMVEAIVSFALTGMFLTAAGIILSQSLRLHYRMKSTIDAVTVSDILLDKITGEIAGAKNSRYPGSTVILTLEGRNGCPSIIFTNREDRIVEITRTGEEGNPYLLLWYYPTKFDPEENPWTYDEKLYQGFVIQELNFEALEREVGIPSNVIRVSLTLHNPRSGFTYSVSRAVPCYQFETEEDCERILVEE